MPVFALYRFDDTGAAVLDGSSEGGSQDGIYLNGAAAAAGQVLLDGQNDLAKFVDNNAFQLDRGTLQIGFSQTAHVGTGPNTLLSRDSVGETEGGFRIDLLADGSLQIAHETTSGVVTLATPAGLVTAGDSVTLSYSWDAGGPGALQIVTGAGGSFSAEVPAGLTMDMGSLNQPWIVGAGQARSTPDLRDNIDQHFNGAVEVFSLSDTVDNGPAPTDSDGIVTGTDRADLIDTAYRGDNDGDVIDGGDARLPGAAPQDDLVRAEDRNDTVYAGLGDDEVQAGRGNDLVFGGVGEDTLIGWQGNDTLNGGDGADLADGGAGNDLIETGRTGTALPDRGYPGLYPDDAAPFDDRDTVLGGEGNDTIRTGDDNDLIRAGSGADSVDGGFDDDTIYGDVGQDTLIGGEGSDLLSGGATSDLIYGGLSPAFPDEINIPDATDLRPDNGRDTIFGDGGDDTLFGMDDADLIYGGNDKDLIDAGIDDDTLFGDADNDTLTGGQGVDVIFGGADRDVILGGNVGDVVDGDETGDDFDTLDLSGAGPVRITYTSADREDGTVDFLDADGNSTGQLTFSNIENVMPCFTPGTLIATPKGEVPVEDLQAGDLVITRDSGIQQIRWAGAKTMDWQWLARSPHLQPVLIRRGSLGDGLPERDMMVSPNHRMLVANDRTALHFDEHEVLVAAKHLVGGPGVHRVESMGTTYLHFMFDRHEVVLANGAWTESFQPGDYTLKGMGNAQRSEIFELFPQLKSPAGLKSYPAARRTLKKHEAKLLTR